MFILAISGKLNHFITANNCQFMVRINLLSLLDSINRKRNEQVNTKQGSVGDNFKSMDEYLLGSRKLKVFPVAMSLVARFVLNVNLQLLFEFLQLRS